MSKRMAWAQPIARPVEGEGVGARIGLVGLADQGGASGKAPVEGPYEVHHNQVLGERPAEMRPCTGKPR